MIDILSQSKKILANIFTAKFKKQDETHAGIGEINRTASDFANIRDSQIKFINSGFVTRKMIKDETFIVLQAGEDESSDLYGLAFTTKAPSIKGLQEGDIRYWNPANKDNNAYFDLKTDGSFKFHNNKAEIGVKANGAISIVKDSSKIEIAESGEISVKNDKSTGTWAKDKIELKQDTSEILVQGGKISIKSKTAAGGQLLLNGAGKVALGIPAAEVVDILLQTLSALGNSKTLLPDETTIYKSLATLLTPLKTPLT